MSVLHDFRYHTVIAVASAFALLSACDGQAIKGDGAEIVAEDNVPATSEEPMLSEVLGDDAAASASSASRVISKYSDISPENCKVIDHSTDEGAWVDMQCPGYADVPLYVSEDDGRMFLYAGNEPKKQITMAPFNNAGDKVEWRLSDGEPFAIIYRLKVVALESPDAGRSQLFVSKIGKGTEPSCIIAEIAGNYPSANKQARQVADANRAFDCKEHEPMTYGNIIP